MQLTRIKLLEKRKLKKMNQEHVADLLQVSKQTYSEIETGKTQKISEYHKKILMEEFDLTEVELDERVGNQGGILQVKSTYAYAIDSQNINNTDREILELLKEEQRKNKELQHQVIALSHKAMDQNSMLSDSLNKLVTKLA